MKKIFFSGVSLVSRLALLLTLTLTGFASANAAGLSGEIEVGQEYPFTSYSSVDVYYVAPADGIVNQFALANVFKDAEHTVEVEITGSGYSDGTQYWTYEVKKGETYYIYDSFAMNGGTLKVTMAGLTPLELLSRSVEEGEAFDFNNYSYITYTFNEPVEYESVKLECGGQTVEPTVVADNYSLNVYVDGIKTMVEDGTIPSGSVASIVFEGLKGKTSEKLYQDQETTTFTFSVFKATKCVSEVWPAVFKSYWPAGSADGIIKLTFERELSETGAVCQLVYGNTEGTLGEDLYVEEVAPVVEGNTLTVDLTGKRRSNDDMVLSGPFTSMIVKVVNIRDIDGIPVASPGAGTVGSYSATLDFEDIARVNLTYETVPANGGSLQGVENLEFWLSGLNSISFDGFKIAYTNEEGEENEVIVPMSEVAKSEVSADGNEATFKFELPEEARNQKNYKVSLNNLEALDGYDHSYDVTAQFDAFVLTYVDPANGTKMKGLEEGQIITASFNMATAYPEMYVVYEVEDLNPTNPDEAIVKSQSWLNRQENGDYTAEIPMFVKMLAGHTYKCTFTAWATEMDKNYKEAPIGTASVEWYGATEAFKYSDVQFVGIVPAEGTAITKEDRTFVLTFDGMVNLPAENNFINLGMGSTMKFESLTAVVEDNEDDEVAAVSDYSNVWKAVVPASYMSTLTGAISLSFKAYDMDGKVVEGNTGEEEQSYFYFSYDLATDSQDVVSAWEITPAQGKVAELSVIEIVFSTCEEVAIGSGFPTLSVNGGEAQRLGDAELDWDIWNKATLNLGQTYTEAGTYVISFPEGYFADENGNNLPAFTLTYELDGQQAVETKDFEVYPEDGTYDFLEMFNVYAEEGIAVAETTDFNQAFVMNMAREIVAYVDNVEADDYGCYLILDNIVDQEGRYTLIIPEGYFTIGGVPSAEKMMYYNIPGKFAVTANPAPGMVKSLNTITLTTSAPVIPQFDELTITSEEGEDIVITNITTNSEEEGWFATEITLTLDEEITALGKYTLTIPAYSFMFESYTYNQEAIEFEYEVVDKVPDVTDAWTITPAQGKVTELSTIEIVFNNYSEIGMTWNGSPTLSIDGGEAQTLNDAELDWDIWNKAILNLGQTYTEAGTYVISFPEGYFEDENWNALPAFTLTFVIEEEDTTGVNGIVAAENGKYVVYNMSGYKVLETENAEDLKQLANGLYIINGVKVYKK